jgi:hypothetical protein
MSMDFRLLVNHAGDTRFLFYEGASTDAHESKRCKSGTVHAFHGMAAIQIWVLYLRITCVSISIFQ